MEEETIISEIKNKCTDTVHHILLCSYASFLIAVIFGVLFDKIIPVKIFFNNIYQSYGLSILFLGSVLIYWAQSTSSNYSIKAKNKPHKSKFEFGPYKFLRNPTHIGLFIMILGLSILINSFFSVVFVFLAHIISRIFFLRKEEKLLEKKYGQDYLNYKKKVKNWL